METTIGGKRFPAFGFGKLSNLEKKEASIRWGTFVGSANLTSLGGSASVAGLINVSTLQSLVMLKSISVVANFGDAGSANYAVSEGVEIVIKNPENNTGYDDVILSARNFIDDCNLLVPVVNSQILIDAAIFGGTVQRLTGISPGAGDGVTFTIAVSYYV